MFKTKLFPNKYKKIGWIILIPSFILGMYLTISNSSPSWLDGKAISIFPGAFESGYFRLATVNFANTLIGVLFIAGALMVGFSKEKVEDEYIAKLRLSALLWAVFVNYVVLIVAFIFIYDTAFLSVMIYNMFTVLILFILRFQYNLFVNAKNLKNAE